MAVATTSRPTTGAPSNSQFGPSEANRVIANYNALTSSQQQDLLNFLRSL